MGPGVIDRNPARIFLQCVVDVHDLGVPDVRAIFLEGDAQDEDLRTFYQHAFLVHALDGLVRHVGAHAVIQPAGVAHHARKDTVHLRLLDKVVGIHADAVAAHKTRAQFDEVPLGCRRLDHVVRVDVHRIEDLRQLVHEGNVDIPLGILDDLGSLRHLDGRSLMRPVHQDGVIDGVHDIGNLRRRAGCHLLDFLHGMELVARIDALRGITGEKVLVELQAGHPLHDGDTLLFRHAGVHGGFIHDDIALGNHPAHRIRGAPERAQVRTVVLVHRCRNRHDIEVAATDFFHIRGALESMVVDRVLQEIVTDLQCRVVPRHQGVHPALVHVKSDGRELGGEQTGQREADIPQADDADLDVFHIQR